MALKRNSTWSLVPATTNMKIVGYRWIFKIKYKADDTVERHKVKLVAKEFHQTLCVDFFETFSPVIEPATIRIGLTIAPSLI